MGSGPRAAMGAWLCVCVSPPMHMHRQKRPRALLDSCCTETIPGNESLMFPVSGPSLVKPLRLCSKLGKEYVKVAYCHPAYLTYMQSTS